MLYSCLILFPLINALFEVKDYILLSHRNYFLFKRDHLTGGEYKSEQRPPMVVIYSVPLNVDPDIFIEGLYEELKSEAGVYIPELLKEKVDKELSEWDATDPLTAKNFEEYKDTIKQVLTERFDEVKSFRGEDNLQHTRQHEFLHAFDFLMSKSCGARPITSELLRGGGAENFTSKIRATTEWELIRDRIIDFCDMSEGYKSYADYTFMSEVMTHLHDRFSKGKTDGINQKIELGDPQVASKALIIIQESINHFAKEIAGLKIESINQNHKLINEGILQYITTHTLKDEITAIKDGFNTTSDASLVSKFVKPSSAKSHVDQFFNPEEIVSPSSDIFPASAISLSNSVKATIGRIR